MTNEEAIEIIRKEYLCVDSDCDIERSCSKCDLMMPSKEPILEAYKLAIKALKQYGVLQEIRNELTKHYVDPYNRNAFRYTTVSLLDVLDLIDNHLKDFNA